jgi:FkbM family methyltransferase
MTGLKESVHRALVRTCVASDAPVVGTVWRRANDLAKRQWGSENVEIKLHGHAAQINFSNPYPFAARRYPNYNAPQVELVALQSEVLGRAVDIIDVGAAVGDTALLLLDRCATAIRQLDCVEGDARFTKTLRANLTDPRIRIHQTMLSNTDKPIPGLIRSQHEGTASAHGDDLVEASTLDILFKDASPDVIKIDTDGYDGNILAGGKDLLARAHPAVLFEWHPPLCELVGTDPMRAFEVLREVGFNRFVFFTKFGQFSHFGADHLEKLVTLCLTSTTLSDWHYDVVAFDATSKLDEVNLADLRHWGSSGYR